MQATIHTSNVIRRSNRRVTAELTSEWGGAGLTPLTRRVCTGAGVPRNRVETISGTVVHSTYMPLSGTLRNPILKQQKLVAAFSRIFAPSRHRRGTRNKRSDITEPLPSASIDHISVAILVAADAAEIPPFDRVAIRPAQYSTILVATRTRGSGVARRGAIVHRGPAIGALPRPVDTHGLDTAVVVVAPISTTEVRSA